MAWLVMNFEASDCDAFKHLFDSDPIGRKAVAKRHRIMRAAEVGPTVVDVAEEVTY